MLVVTPQTVHLYTIFPVFWQVAAVVVPLSGLCPVAAILSVFRTFLQSLHLVTLEPAFIHVGFVVSTVVLVCLHTVGVDDALVIVILHV